MARAEVPILLLSEDCGWPRLPAGSGEGSGTVTQNGDTKGIQGHELEAWLPHLFVVWFFRQDTTSLSLNLLT